MAASDKVRRYTSRRDKLRADKTMWLTHFEDLARLMLPRRMGFISHTVEGERRTEEIYDGTPMMAARGLANAIGQLMRPEGEKWFFIKAEDDILNQSDEVRDWLHRVEEITRDAIYNPKARFRQSVGEADTDLVVFGTAVNFVGLSKRAARRLHFMTLHLKDVEIALDDEGNVDTLFETRRYTLRQAEQKFTREKLSEELRNQLNSASDRNDTNLDQRYEFLRVVEPRAKGREDAILSKNMLFTNDWMEIGSSHMISEGGFREFPFVCPRWDTSSGEVYGRSPGMIALPDSETVNAQGETILVTGQKTAEPPIFAPNDSSFDAVNTFSGGISYYDVDTAVQLRGNPFFTLDTGFNLPITRDMQLDTRLQIEAAFFRNIFNLPVKGPEMTATEVIARKEEFIREIGAVFGRLESDYVAPQVERAFRLLMSIGMFNPIPEALINRNVTFEYTSPIKRIREQAEAAASRLWVQELMELSTVKPEVMDIPNIDEIARHSARALDLPPAHVNSREDVEAERQKRQQQEDEIRERAKTLQEMEAVSQGGKLAKDVSQAIATGQQAQQQPAEPQSERQR